MHPPQHTNRLACPQLPGVPCLHKALQQLRPSLAPAAQRKLQQWAEEQRVKERLEAAARQAGSKVTEAAEQVQDTVTRKAAEIDRCVCVLGGCLRAVSVRREKCSPPAQPCACSAPARAAPCAVQVVQCTCPTHWNLRAGGVRRRQGV